jgi:hypothetical protein
MPRARRLQENPVALVSAAKPYEVQKYASLANRAWEGSWALMSAKAWSALSPNLKALVSRSSVPAPPHGPKGLSRNRHLSASSVAGRCRSIQFFFTSGHSLSASGRKASLPGVLAKT